MVPSLILSVMSWYFSTLDWTGFTSKSTFVGLGNYRQLVHDMQFWSAFGRSFLFVVVAVPIRLVLSLIVAIILNDQMMKVAPFFLFLQRYFVEGIAGAVKQ